MGYSIADLSCEFGYKGLDRSAVRMCFTPGRTGVDRAIENKCPKITRLPRRFAIRVMARIPQCIKLVKSLVVAGVKSAEEARC